MVYYCFSFCLSGKYLPPLGAVFIFIWSLLQARADFVVHCRRINARAKRCAGYTVTSGSPWWFSSRSKDPGGTEFSGTINHEPWLAESEFQVPVTGNFWRMDGWDAEDRRPLSSWSSNQRRSFSHLSYLCWINFIFAPIFLYAEGQEP